MAADEADVAADEADVAPDAAPDDVDAMALAIVVRKCFKIYLDYCSFCLLFSFVIVVIILALRNSL